MLMGMTSQPPPPPPPPLTQLLCQTWRAGRGRGPGPEVPSHGTHSPSSSIRSIYDLFAHRLGRSNYQASTFAMQISPASTWTSRKRYSRGSALSGVRVHWPVGTSLGLRPAHTHRLFRSWLHLLWLQSGNARQLFWRIFYKLWLTFAN